MGLNYIIGAPGEPHSFDTDGTLNQEYRSGALGGWTANVGYSYEIPLGAATISNAGTGYGANSGAEETYTNVAVLTNNNNGAGALATITITSGAIDTVTITAPGTGYTVGSVLPVVCGTGTNGRLTVATLAGTGVATVTKTTAGSGYGSNATYTGVEISSGTVRPPLATVVVNADRTIKSVTITESGDLSAAASAIGIVPGTGNMPAAGSGCVIARTYQAKGYIKPVAGGVRKNTANRCVRMVKPPSKVAFGQMHGTYLTRNIYVPPEGYVSLHDAPGDGGSGYNGGNDGTFYEVPLTGGTVQSGGYVACATVEVEQGVVTLVTVPSALKTGVAGSLVEGAGYTQGEYTGVHVRTYDDIGETGGRFTVVTPPEATVVVGADGKVDSVTITSGGDLGGGRGSGFAFVPGTGTMPAVTPSTLCTFVAPNCKGQGYTVLPTGIDATGGGMTAGGEGCDIELVVSGETSTTEIVADFWFRLNSDMLMPGDATDPKPIQLLRFHSGTNRPRLVLVPKRGTGANLNLDQYYQLQWSTSGTGGGDTQDVLYSYTTGVQKQGRTPQIMSGQWTHIRLLTKGWMVGTGSISAQIWVDGIPMPWVTGLGGDHYCSAAATASSLPASLWLGPCHTANELQESAWDISFDDIIVAAGYKANGDINAMTPVQAMHTNAVVPLDRDCNEVAVTVNMQFGVESAQINYGPTGALGHTVDMTVDETDTRHLTARIPTVGYETLYWQVTAETVMESGEFGVPDVEDSYASQIFSVPCAVTGDTKVAVIGDVQEYAFVERTFSNINRQAEESLFITTGDFVNFVDMGPVTGEGAFGVYDDWDDLEQRALVERRAFRLTRAMNQRSMWFPNIGNHEMDGLLAPTGWDWYFSRVPQPSPNWALDWGYARFVSIAPRYVTSPVAGDSDDVDLLSFIRSQFSRDADRWQILVNHYPGYGNGYTATSVQPFKQRKELHDVLVEVGCQLVINGHINYWNRYVADGVCYYQAGVPSAESSTFKAPNVVDGTVAPGYGSRAGSMLSQGGHTVLDIKDSTLDIITIGRRTAVPIDAYRIVR